jgi:hypothetical protein
MYYLFVPLSALQSCLQRKGGSAEYYWQIFATKHDASSIFSCHTLASSVPSSSLTVRERRHSLVLHARERHAGRLPVSLFPRPLIQLSPSFANHALRLLAVVSRILWNSAMHCGQASTTHGGACMCNSTASSLIPSWK